MKPRVLIVDDSLTVRMDLTEAFEAAEFEVVGCATLQSAREALAAGRFVLIVLDVLLPDGDGIQLLDEIRHNPELADLPVILLSSEAQVRDHIRGMKTGADEYVGKPYDLGYVVARGRELLRARASKVGPQERTTILLIDDSISFREAMRTVLESAGYRVITAGSGEEGLHAAFNYRPSAVLVDSRLPGIDGATVVRRLRADAALRRMPCLLLTAHEDPAEELSALEAGADGFLRKDAEPEVVLARLAALLRSASTPAAVEPHASVLGPKKILAVDDNVAYLDALAPQLRQDGFDVVLAHNGEEALELLAVETVDCILLDIVMPGISGHEVCRRIKAAPALRNIPLLMLTGLEEPQAMLEGINAGADDYIPKSSDFEVIRAHLRAALRRKQFEDENRSVREQLLRKEVETAAAHAQRELAETRAALLTELHESEERVRIAAEAADLGVWLWDLTVDRHVWSDRCKQLFGLPDIVDPKYQDFLNILHPDDRARAQEAMREALDNKTEYEVEYRVIWPDHSLHWLTAKGRGLYDKSGKPLRITGVVMDVTDRKRTEQALIRSEKLASVGRMAATMAHEINNPLEAVVNALFLISCDESLSPETRNNLEMADRELSRVAHMTKQTLGFYREHSRPSVVQLSELVDDLLGLYSRKLNHKKIVVHREYRASGELRGIAGELRQIVSNLISNSIDALQSHGVIHIRIASTTIKQYALRLTIADSGSGIKPEHLTSIFEPFFTTNKEVGTGLGLWVSRQIVEKHEGRIRVRSRYGKGTVFCVYLPYGAIDSAAPGGDQRSAASASIN